jgi:hypothetical protein
MAASQALKEQRITIRAATIYFWLGLVELLMPFDRNVLILYNMSLPLWTFSIWAVCAAYATYLSLLETSPSSLRVLATLTFIHLFEELAYGVFLPWGGTLLSELGDAVNAVLRPTIGDSGLILYILGDRGMAVGIAALAFYAHGTAKAKAIPT